MKGAMYLLFSQPVGRRRDDEIFYGFFKKIEFLACTTYHMKKIFWIIKLLIMMGMFVTAYYVYPAMPEKFPTHWNFDGYIDGYASKVFEVYLFPVLPLAIAFLMPLVRYMDPRKERFKPFEKPWEVIQFILILFLAYLFFVMLYIVAHPGVSINPFMMMGLGILFVLLGNYMGKIRQNYMVGIRVPWTIDNEEVWNKNPLFRRMVFCCCWSDFYDERLF
jgi:uncharacterized membrane protein